MALYLDGNVDLLAISGNREIDGKLPWHFTSIKVPPEGDLAKIRHWIWHNLEGRFAITISEGANWVSNYVVGFEDPSEASAFVISLPLMIEQNDWL